MVLITLPAFVLGYVGFEFEGNPTGVEFGGLEDFAA